MNAAERIYISSTREGAPASRLAEELARRIEDDIASRDLPPGGALGSLRELSERYSVGRSVAREALGLLERRGLGRLRPGPFGGFILAQPEPGRIGEQLADYFRATGLRLHQLLDAREAVDLMAARLAASAHAGDGDLKRLEAASAAGDLAGSLCARVEIARLAAEPVLLMFVECLNSLTLDFARADQPLAPAQRREARGEEALNRRAARKQPHGESAMSQALRTGNVEAGVLAAKRAHSDLAKQLVEREPEGQVAVTASRLPAAGGTLATSIARTLAAEIVGSGRTGTRLGSEWDLCERFDVSRLTLRQAVRLLQDSGLVECRRGRGNGLVVRDQRAPGAIRLMLAYLIGEKLNPMAAGTILFQINCFVPALAVTRAHASERQELEAALLRVEACDPFDRYDLLGLVHCVSRVADSPIIDLFSRGLAAYEARFRQSLAERLPASAQCSYFRLVRRLLDRVPVGDPSRLEWAKAESSALMLDMSLRRPI
jgi:DNA-binding FadR family transcriptional regulator